MRKKQYIGIGCIVVAVICIILFGVKIIGSEPNVNQHSKTPISRKYKKDQVTTLTAEKSVLNLYLPKEGLADTEHAVMAYTKNDKLITGKDYSCLNKQVSKIIITLKDNTIINYSLGDNTYSKNSLDSLGSDIKTFKLKTLKVMYTHKKVDDKHLYYEAINLSKNHSLLIIFESFDELNKDTLKSYAERICI